MRPHHPTLRRLNAEWQELASAPVPPGWRTQPPLSEAVDLAGVLTSVRAAPDPVLGALLRCGDGVAHRTVLQAMLGRAVLDAARDPSHDLDDYVAELWLRIATYPLARRPTSIAANLALDTRKQLRERTRAQPVDPSQLATLVGYPEPGAEAALLIARARRRGLISATTERTLRLVYAEGFDARRAAEVMGTSYPALRQRCRRALRRLADHAAALQGVAA